MEDVPASEAVPGSSQEKLVETYSTVVGHLGILASLERASHGCDRAAIFLRR